MHSSEYMSSFVILNVINVAQPTRITSTQGKELHTTVNQVCVKDDEQVTADILALSCCTSQCNGFIYLDLCQALLVGWIPDSVEKHTIYNSVTDIES